ncbi:hypothetical protein C8Q76DRAFT_801880 [Earliella scabrosa]|nr:hypothetical protein C8Q76DRAFT_801880 [Earliella scabrosa]
MTEPPLSPSPPQQPSTAGVSDCLASSPFDRVGADIVLRTADGVDFRVYSHVLVLASSFFDAMLSLPQPESQSEQAAGRPIITVTEDSKTIETLLRICYPIDKEETSRSLTEIEQALKAAIKYDMALPLTVLRKALIAAAPDAPKQAWATACRTGLEDAARHAATLMLPYQPLNLTPDDIEGVTAAEYYRVREFHRLGGVVDPNFCLLSPLPQAAAPDGDASMRPSESTTSSPPHESFPYMPYTDLICVSSDDVEFHVHRGTLSAASPILHEKIQALSTAADAPVSLQLEDRGVVLSVLFKMCYPVNLDEPALSSDLYTFADVLSSAQKYQMEGVCRALKRQWHDLARAEPLHAYFLAIHAGWKKCAEDAARCLAFVPLDGAYFHAMESMPAVTYHKLLVYHNTSAVAIQRHFSDNGCYGSFVELRDARTFSGMHLTASGRVDCNAGSLLEGIAGTASGRYYNVRDYESHIRSLRDVFKSMPNVSLEPFDAPGPQSTLKAKVKRGKKAKRKFAATGHPLTSYPSVDPSHRYDRCFTLA